MGQVRDQAELMNECLTAVLCQTVDNGAADDHAVCPHSENLARLLRCPDPKARDNGDCDAGSF